MSLRAAEYNKAPLCRDKHASYSTIHSVKLDMNALKRIFSPRKKKNPLLEGKTGYYYFCTVGMVLMSVYVCNYTCLYQ